MKRTVFMIVCAICALPDVDIIAQACLRPPTGLVGWWPGDGNASDRIAGNHGTPVNGATFALGVSGQAFDFDGIDDYVEFGDVLNQLALPVSIEGWMKTTGSPDRQGIFWSDNRPVGSAGYFGFWINMVNNLMAISYGDGGTCGCPLDRQTKSANTPIPMNQWFHFVTVIRAAQDMSIYINGQEVAGTYSGSGGPMVHNSWTARLGVTDAFSLDGSLDEVAIYSRALTADEVLAIYLAGTAGKCKVESLCDDFDDDNDGRNDEGCDDDADGYCDTSMIVVGSPLVCENGPADCDDTNANAWATPSEASDLAYEASLEGDELRWTQPTSPGAVSLVYDLLRTALANDFLANSVCLESDDGPNTLATDAAVPGLGDVFFYLVRPENACPLPAGIGPLGAASNGTVTSGRDCP